ncbi:MAG: DUF4468 domain-containing protein [Mucilaginibacter sp.]|nr:DUF4468 domain-containing protein [Mucilaginibacter sp.]
MKRLFLIAIIAVASVAAKAQSKAGIQLDSIPVVDGKYQFQEVVTVDNNITKDQLYKKAKTYFMDIFTGAQNAFQYDDAQEGKIVGKGVLIVNDYKSTFPSVAVLKWDINYNTEIICKDGKYRVRIYDIVVTKESHVAENNSRSVNYTIADLYARMANQRGPYKTLYPKVFNKMTANFKERMGIIKEYMDKNNKADYAVF